MDQDTFPSWLGQRLQALREEDSHLDNTIRGLSDRREQLARQITELETAQAIYAGWKKPDSTNARKVLRPEAAVDLGTAPEAVADRVAKAELRRLTIPDALAEIIRRQGRPTGLPILVSALQSAGKMQDSTLHVAKNVVTLAMKKQPERFVRVAPGIWTLTNKLLAEAPHSNGGE